MAWSSEKTQETLRAKPKLLVEFQRVALNSSHKYLETDFCTKQSSKDSYVGKSKITSDGKTKI